jgi:hypothetical protein
MALASSTVSKRPRPAGCGVLACAAFATSASAIAPAATPERAMPFMESLMHLSFDHRLCGECMTAL